MNKKSENIALCFRSIKSAEQKPQKKIIIKHHYYANICYEGYDDPSRLGQTDMIINLPASKSINQLLFALKLRVNGGSSIYFYGIPYTLNT